MIFYSAPKWCQVEHKKNTTITENLDVKKITTIHELKGGKTFNGWRGIDVGPNLMLGVNNIGYGFNSNGYFHWIQK